MVPARPIARNGLARAFWLMPSDCQAVISLSDDKRLQAIPAPKSRETGRVMTAMLGIKHSSNFWVTSEEDWKDNTWFEYLPSCWTKTRVVSIRNSMQTRGMISLIVCQNILHFINLPIYVLIPLSTAGRCQSL